MDIDNEFIKKYGKLIRSRLKAEGVRKQDRGDYETLVYERLLSNFTYDEERGTFTTWLGWVVKSVVSNQRKKESRSQDALDHAVDLDAASNVIGVEDAGTVQDELDRLFEAADLSQRDENLMKDIHLRGYTYEEAAERYDMSLEAVKKAGGSITVEPFSFPGGRRFSFTDPSGNELAVWTPA